MRLSITDTVEETFTRTVNKHPHLIFYYNDHDDDFIHSSWCYCTAVEGKPLLSFNLSQNERNRYSWKYFTDEEILV